MFESNNRTCIRPTAHKWIAIIYFLLFFIFLDLQYGRFMLMLNFIYFDFLLFYVNSLFNILYDIKIIYLIITGLIIDEWTNTLLTKLSLVQWPI